MNNEASRRAFWVFAKGRPALENHEAMINAEYIWGEAWQARDAEVAALTEALREHHEIAMRDDDSGDYVESGVCERTLKALAKQHGEG